MSAINPHQNAFNVQKAATDPEAHVWITASAGTGKTKVLTDRILRLLLKGTSPRKILCLTFTQAAAAEMMQRVIERLGFWATCSDLELTHSLQTLNSTLSEDHMKRVRHLFVDVLETPGGFRIQTIHGFCQSLLTAFPLEAGIALETSVLTTRAREDILRRAQEEVLKASTYHSELGKAMTLLAEQFHSETFKQLCDTLLQEKLKLTFVLAPGKEAVRTALLKALDLSKIISTQDILTELWSNSLPFLEALKNTAHILSRGGVTDLKRGEAIFNWIKNSKTLDTFHLYAAHFLTAEGEIRQKLFTKEIVKEFPEIKEVLEAEARRIYEASEVLKRIKVAEISLALVEMSHELLRHYEILKMEQHVLDYDDLILKANILLHNPEFASWVLYKLDGGIDHLLVDEAQDTNTLQWSIIQALTEEFFSGQGARDQTRTLFAVGDPKQSIYSFQGTDPEIFSAIRDHFAGHSQSKQEKWHHLEMNLSFRSTKEILTFIDLLFSHEEARAGVQEQGPLEHFCFRKTQEGGRVELWPLVTQDQDTKEEQNLDHKLAQQVAHNIEDLLQRKEMLPALSRPVQPQDIMVLVRRRTPFILALIQALKTKSIPVSGLDRLRLLENLAIQDLIALGEFLLLPENDFALACLLKSPFGGLTEDDLFMLASTRDQKTLWENLKYHKGKYPDLYEKLSDLLRQVDFISPFELYSDVLLKYQGLQKILVRFNQEAKDPVEEFLTLAYEYQQQFPASLQGFLEWLRQGQLEIKRDFSQAGLGEIRIMTVHGAKGLQAPIVILADTTSRPRYKENFLWPDAPIQSFLWSPPQSQETTLTHRLKQKVKTVQDQEYRRLLYVALTRAEDHLYICGAQEGLPIQEGSWYHFIEKTFKKMNAERISFPEGEGFRFQNTSKQSFLPKNFSDERQINHPEEPSWLFKPLLTKQELPQRISVTQECHLQSEDFPEGIKERGQLIHKLLEVLPPLSPESRLRKIQLIEKSWSEKKLIFQEAVQIVYSILESPSLNRLFHPSSRAEVSLISQKEGKLYTARIDRLVILEQEIWIVDYKSDRLPPATKEALKDSYKQQLYFYRELVKPLYPQLPIKTMILWTQTATLMEI